jgi:protein phosphatase
MTEDAGASLAVHGLSDVGRFREDNEDNWGCHVFANVHLLIVADGMGGHAGGKVASRLAVETIRETFERMLPEGDVAAAINRAMSDANARIREMAVFNEDLKGMGATCITAAVRNGLLYYTHVGDCRLYILRGGELKRVTSDHTMVQRMVEMGILTIEMARMHPDKNIVSRALGGGEFIELDDPVEPIALEPGDRFILCSDGLFDLVGDDEIRSALSNGDPGGSASKLVEIANEAGGRDNVTVVVGFFG